MTDQQIALERLAKQCVEGDPWYCEKSFDFKRYGILTKDTKFIAAASPETVILLIADIRRLEEEAKTMRNSALEEAANKCDFMASLTLSQQSEAALSAAANQIRKMKF